MDDPGYKTPYRRTVRTPGSLHYPTSKPWWLPVRHRRCWCGVRWSKCPDRTPGAVELHELGRAIRIRRWKIGAVVTVALAVLVSVALVA